ncbi:MAG: hypothetical protein OHK0047_44520 [Leptolyngbyaceae cyanobacterium]
MKSYTPLRMLPSTNQFHEWTRDMRQEVRQSSAYFAVFHLYLVTTSLYRTLNDCTSERLSHLVSANAYLTPRQEHDAIALIAACVASLDTLNILNIVKSDATITEEERAILLGAVKSWKDVSMATHNALGNPRWID